MSLYPAWLICYPTPVLPCWPGEPLLVLLTSIPVSSPRRYLAHLKRHGLLPSPSSQVAGRPINLASAPRWGPIWCADRIPRAMGCPGRCAQKAVRLRVTFCLVTSAVARRQEVAGAGQTSANWSRPCRTHTTRASDSTGGLVMHSFLGSAQSSRHRDLGWSPTVLTLTRSQGCQCPWSP